MQKFLLIAFLFTTRVMVGQNYQAFYSGQDRIYDHGNGMIGLKIDSTSFDGDSVFYFHPNIAFDFNNNCGSIDVASWMGKRLTISPNGDHIFINLNNEEILIRAGAELGENWICYSSPDQSFHVQAEVISLEGESVFDMNEEVKTITLQALDINLEPISSYLNDAYFRLSESLGLLSTPKLGDFPFANAFDGGLMRNLLGISPEIGIQNLTSLDIFDFQIGDALEVEIGNNSFEYTNLYHQAFLYLDRVDFMDSTIYSIREILSSYSGLASSINYVVVDTFYYNQTFTNTDQFSQVPGYPIRLDEYSVTFTSMDNGEYGLGKFYPNGAEYEMYFDGSDSCYYQAIDAGCNFEGDHWYYPHLGGPYYFCSNSLTSNHWRKLKYANTSAGIFGTPLSTSDYSASKSLKLFPNPATTQFSIEVSDGQIISSISVFDIAGRLKIRNNSNASLVVLSTATLEPGVYNVVTELGNGQKGVKKLVKQ